MKKQLLIPITMVLLLSVACSFFGLGADDEASETIVRPTNTAVNPELPDTPTKMPDDKKDEVKATEAPECPVTGTYDFDEPTGCWPDNEDGLFSVTEFSYDGKISSGVKNGMYEFEVNIPQEVFLYAFNNNNLYQEVILEADINKIEPSVNKNGFIMACHVNEKGWYETRIESGGFYHVFRYDTYKRENGENPYSTLSEGGSTALDVGDHTNTIRFECMQDSLGLYINGEEVWSDDVSIKNGGGIGLGVRTFADASPVHIAFDHLTVLTP
ncbi:MAG: hypothetical protein JEZ06_12600 [Anaerolineaceae bacterium]|nr:hypothetical protein [Anaerolineaceae bacterium]